VPDSLCASNIQSFIASYSSFRNVYPNRPPLLGGNCDALRPKWDQFVSERKSDLEKLFRESDGRLHPFVDPLCGNLLMLFILANDREESYSAVLEWLIHRLPARDVLRVFGLDDIGIDQSPWVTTREYQIRHGGQAGRLDLILRRNGRCRVVIEVKTKPYTEEDLLKHELYCAAIHAAPDMHESEKIFLAQRDEDMDLGGFVSGHGGRCVWGYVGHPEK
jgi:hypothetical protein